MLSKKTIFVLGVVSVCIWAMLLVLIFEDGRHTSSQARQLATQQQLLDTQQAQLKVVSRNQVANRASNVRLWCSAINDGRRVERQIATHYNINFPLLNLDCNQLVAATKQSAKVQK